MDACNANNVVETFCFALYLIELLFNDEKLKMVFLNGFCF